MDKLSIENIIPPDTSMCVTQRPVEFGLDIGQISLWQDRSWLLYWGVYLFGYVSGSTTKGILFELCLRNDFRRRTLNQQS